MFSKIRNLFSSNKPAFNQLMMQGAIIIDVRSKSEFSGGHVKGAINIPLDQLANSIAMLKAKQVPIITCCKSGMRSAMAVSTLSAKGIKAYNGGSWNSLLKQLSQS